VIGAVNVYIQLYDENMKPLKNDGDEYLVSPGDISKHEYVEDVVGIRRGRMRAV